MKPIVLLGIMAVIGGFASTGFLAPEIGQVWLQNIGVGERDLESPLTHAAVDLDVAPSEGVDQNGNPIFKNKFVSCSFHSGEVPLEGDLDKVICKLTNDDDKAIAEGTLQFCPDPVPVNGCGDLPEWEPSTHYVIQPLIEAYPNALLLDNVHDVKLVVLGDDPTDDPPMQ